MCIFLGMPPSLLGSEGLGAKEAGFCASSVWWGGGLQVALRVLRQDGAGETTEQPCPPFLRPLQSLPILGGIFSKIPLRLGPNYLFPNRLVTDGAGEKGKASHAMGGHLVQQPAP